MSRISLFDSLGVSGLIHVWGLPASGKTLFAVAAAASASKEGPVEWINCDGKRGFIRALKQSLQVVGGDPASVTLSFPTGPAQCFNAVLSTARITDRRPALVVIDPVTRVLDMSRSDPLMWGRTLIEDVLPTLAALSHDGTTDVVIVSESRMLENSGPRAVHHGVIRRWCSYDLLIRRGLKHGHSEILVTNAGDEPSRIIGYLTIDADGTVAVSARSSPAMREVA